MDSSEIVGVCEDVTVVAAAAASAAAAECMRECVAVGECVAVQWLWLVLRVRARVKVWLLRVIGVCAHTTP